MSVLDEAIEAVLPHLETMTGEWSDVYGLIIEAARKSQQPSMEDELAEALILVLPLAKGYAHANPVGSNAMLIRKSDEALAKYRERKK